MGRPRARRWVTALSGAIAVVVVVVVGVGRWASVETRDVVEVDETRARGRREAIFAAFGDRVSDGLCASVETAAAAGVDVRVVGLNETEFDLSHVSHAKSKKIHGYLKLLSDAELREKYGLARDDALVVLSDSSDVIYTRDAAWRVVDAYDELRRALAPSGKALVLFSAEGNCWPHMAGEQELIPGGREYCAKFHERANGSSNKYLNSGGVIGPVFALADLYREVQSSMKTVNDEDQMMTALAYAKQIDEERAGTYSKDYVIALDHESRIFQTGWHTHLEIPGKYAEPQLNGAYYDASRGVFVNTEHNSTPSIVHFNGGKTNFLPVAHDVLRRRPPDDETYAETRRRARARHAALANCSAPADQPFASSPPPVL